MADDRELVGMLRGYARCGRDQKRYDWLMAAANRILEMADDLSGLRAEYGKVLEDIEAGRLVRLKFEPHTFVSFLDEDNQIKEHYRYLSSYLKCGIPLHIVYHGSKPFEFYLAADSEICEDTPEARAALEKEVTSELSRLNPEAGARKGGGKFNLDLDV